MDEVNNVESGLVSLLANLLKPETLAFFSGLGMWGWIAIGAALLLLGIGSWLLLRWVRKRAAERAQRASDEHARDNDASLPGNQSRLERGVRDSVERVREWVRKNGKKKD